MSGLTGAELAWLAAQIRALPGGWTLEIVAEPADTSAVLLPAEGDRFAATYLIDRVDCRLRVMACRWDLMNPAGVFSTLDEAFAPIAAAALAAAEATPFPNLQ